MRVRRPVTGVPRHEPDRRRTGNAMYRSMARVPAMLPCDALRREHRGGRASALALSPQIGNVTVRATGTGPRRRTSRNGDGMKLSMERSALLRAMSRAQSVVERRNTIPILVQRADRGRGRPGQLPRHRPRHRGDRPGAGDGEPRRRDHGRRRTRCTRSPASCRTARWSSSSTTASPAGSTCAPGARTSASRRCRARTSRSWRARSTRRTSPARRRCCGGCSTRRSSRSRPRRRATT